MTPLLVDLDALKEPPNTAHNDADVDRQGNDNERDEETPSDAQKARKRDVTDASLRGWAEDDPTFQTTIYVLPEARRLAKARRDDTGQLNATIAMDAVDEALRHEWLPTLIAKRQQKPRPEDSRFPSRRAVRRSRPRGLKSNPRVIWQLFFTADELKVLDEIIDETGAASRSELVSVALEWYFIDERANPNAHPPTTLRGTESMLNLDDYGR
ncbi:hypothetical protein [Amycolatopsis magusensis]|uniref:hypothetical protein n=1 Tax=Amycolatopsis magusensis TaxID=882444 RepID=UPI0037AF3D85